MAGKTRHPEHKSPTRASNVIRLRPRQWLETCDDLVPIGHRESQPADDSGATRDALRGSRDASVAANRASRPRDAHDPAAAWIGAGEDVVPISSESSRWRGDEPPSASDFWGEFAADLQDAVHAPVPAPDRQEPPRQSLRPRPQLGSLSAATVRRVRATLDAGRRVRITRSAGAVGLLGGRSRRTRSAGAIVRRGGRMRLTRPAAAAALAVSIAAIGAFIASGALTGASTGLPATASSGAHGGALNAPGRQAPVVIKAVTPPRIPPLARAPVHRPRSRPAKRHAVTTRPPATAGETASSTSVASTAAQAAAASPSPSRSEQVSSGSTGPSGVVSLIGAGTTPSG